MADIQRIPFQDDELYAIVDERTGKEYVLPKPMVELFGLDWSGQLRKLNRSQLFNKGMEKMSIPSAGGEQSAVLLERRLVHAWLLSIDISRVSEERQGKLLRYQEECAKVLDEYFTHGAAMRHATKGDLLVQMAEAYRAQERRLMDVETTQRLQRQQLLEHQAALIAQLQLSQAANAKIDLALASQQWLTIREYRHAYSLQRQLPDASCKAYGTYLTRYCLEQRIPVRDQGIADRQWGKEHAYHAETIAATLPGWLAREQGQVALAIVPKGSPA